MITDQEVRELLDRLRRLETKVTGYLESQGYTMDGQKPTWDGAYIQIPTPAVSLRDCLSVVPVKSTSFMVICKDEVVCTIGVPS